MKKYISFLFIISVLIFGALSVNTVSAQSMSTCQLVEMLISISVIPVQSTSTARTALGCTVPVNPPANNANYTITVLSPNGGEVLYQNATTTITWQDSWRQPSCPSGMGCALPPPTFSIHLDHICSDGTVCGVDTLALRISWGSFAWKINPLIASAGLYKVRVCDSYNNQICDSSNYSFTIASTTPTDDGRFYPSVTLIDPVITNNSVSLNGVAYPVSGELNDDWCKATNRNAGTGPFEFNWGDNSKSCSYFPATHAYQNGGQYRIEVRVKNSRGLISSRDKYVTILASTTPAATTTPYVTIVSPNGGNNFSHGQKVPISFATNLTSADMSGINIKLYDPMVMNSATAYKNIVLNWSGGSPYIWTIPTTVAPGNYMISINPQWLSSTANNNLFDLSNSTFKISSSTTIVPVTVANTCTFNPEKYANFYPDIKSVLGFDSAKLRNHWLIYGIAEGRTPCGAEMPGCKFNGENYVNLHPDLKKAGVNGRTHYTQTGINEGRYICKENTTL